MAAYKALYREWRPTTFQEVIGQDHISKTLQNAVEHGRIAHAYLFSGPRGTGKTSSAKVLAKALNCEHGPTSEPCNECEYCKRINTGISMDVMEIDAASNRGIDEIRDLREKVKFAATEGRYKVYIIDEVHMLTTEAFNALLKTLEEPPDKVVFVLATTEPHKIPATILSRVQRFDFKRISIPDIVNRLKTVTADFPQEVEEDALLLIARKAEGGMRDALSLLDQCYSSEQKMDTDRVIKVLGALSEQDIYVFCDHIIDNNLFELISSLNRFVMEGKECGQIVREVVEHLRNLLILKATNDASNLIYVSSEAWVKLREQSNRVSMDRLTDLISLFIKSESEIKNSNHPRITFEVSLIKACTGNKSDATQNLHHSPSYPEKKVEVKEQVCHNIEQDEKQIRDNHKVLKSSNIKEIENRESNLQSSILIIKENWQKALDAVKKANIGTYAFLVEGSPISLDNNILSVGFKEKNTFHRDKINQPENKKIVEQALFSVLGYAIGIKCTTVGEFNDIVDESQDLVSQTYQIFPEELVEVKD